MKKLLLQVLCLMTCLCSQSQFVNIPDSNFRKYLNAQYPQAMNGTAMDTSSSFIINTTSMMLDSLAIADLTGVEYFDNLQYLDCSANMLHALPTFSNTLTTLICNRNMLDSLPSLPTSLTSLECYSNQLSWLPNLPSTLTLLNCSVNHLTALPSLPNGLVNVNCSMNQLVNLPALPASLTTLTCNDNLLNSLTGLPNGLSTLDCSFNPILTLPNPLPSNLISLRCDMDSLSVIPPLPTTLNSLSCNQNLLTGLPQLPSTLHSLYCNHNQLDSLPILPASLINLNCGYNAIPQLPLLPTGLLALDYSGNPVSVLPVQPSTLSQLTWNDNPTSTMPVLPSALISLLARNNNFTALPSLPVSLQYLDCNNDSLTALPLLPSGLKTLFCANNLLPSLPTIPIGIYVLNVSNNSISSLLFDMPFIQHLDCSYNSNLNCLPKLPSYMDYLSVAGTGISCLPNTVTFTDTISTAYISTFPLCMPGSGCPVAWNIAGNVHQFVASNCVQDSLSPGPAAKNLTVDLLSSGNPLDHLRITQHGDYSFDVPINNTYQVSLQTAGLPFNVVCPANNIHTVTPTTLDSLKSGVSFGIECTGLDVAVKSIMGRFRPSVQSTIAICAGDLAQFYNVQCNLPGSAEVTIYLQGPISYMQPASGALTPTSVNGNVISYSIPSIGSVNLNTAFNIEVLTAPDATLGNVVCVKVDISSPSDINLSNNSLSMCFPVVNSFDPNAKEVYPEYAKQAGDELTYTIHFQNTGNDTAYRIVIRDQLSANLDWNSFKYVNSSHDVSIGIKGPWVTFTFDQINLIDDKHDEPNSHGWVMFTIRLKQGLPMGTKTENKASIYFDGNTPIITNTAFNYIGLDTSKFVRVRPILVPEGITPNQDGLNEYWHILNHEYLDRKKITVQQVLVRDRWGGTVFMGVNNLFEWRPNDNIPIGTYQYIIKYLVNSIDHDIQYGTIEVIR